MSEESDDIGIRAARSEDAAVIADIWFHGWQDGHLGHVPEELVRARTAESFGDRARARLGDTRVLVVEGSVAGFTMVVGDEVEQVYVAPAARGRGGAAALLADAERLIAANGHAAAWLAVVAGNLRARRFYERNGWIDDGPFEYAAAVGSGSASSSAAVGTGVILVPSRRYTKHLLT